jgi:hypothetical protein
MKTDCSTTSPDASLRVDVQHQSIALVETDFHRPETLTFRRFDSAMGNLNAVIITCEIRIILSGSVRNEAAHDRMFGVSVAVELAVITSPSLPSRSLLTVPSVSAVFSLPAGASANIPWNSGVDQKVALLSAPADLALFLGNSSWKMHVSTMTKHTVQGGGGAITNTLRAKAAFDVMVQYEFTRVDGIMPGDGELVYRSPESSASRGVMPPSGRSRRTHRAR